ncbi:MAG TPA: hypothetical protein VE338_05225 [Ktedonobacterales bacterium]|nr:hypothetical protein [Ktedonobacterales bacterium]
MDRLYKALAWLAGIALVVGLARAILMWTLAINTLGQGNGVFQTVSLFSVFLSDVSAARAQEILSVANLFVSGVTVMALVIAWADQRRGWLIALIVAALVAMVWPLGVEMWDISGWPLAPQPYPMPVSMVAQIVNDSILAIPLIPPVMALIVGLTRHDGAAQNAHGIAVQPL